MGRGVNTPPTRSIVLQRQAVLPTGRGFAAQCTMTSLEESLSAVEQQIDQVSQALLAADPPLMEKHSAALREAAARFSASLEQTAKSGIPVSAAIKKRMDAVGAMLTVHRESLARMSAINQRQVAGVLPPSDNLSTYESGTGARAAQPGVARIYRSAS